MSRSRTVTVVHPDSRIRISLRTLLEGHGCTVATYPSCADLISGKSDFQPDLIFIDHSLLASEGIDVLYQLNHKWDEAETVFLSENLSHEMMKPGYAPQFLLIVDRLLQMQTTRELLICSTLHTPHAAIAR